RRGLIIGIAAAAAVVLAAGIITPIVIHNNNVKRGDELAADFTTKLDAYNSTWNAENIGVLDDVSLASQIPNGDIGGFSDGTISSIGTACEDLATVKEKRDELANASVPELVEDEAATASEAYVDAQSRAEALGSQRAEAETLLSETETLYGDMQEFCDNIGAYGDANAKMRENEAGVYQDAFVVENGGRFDSSDGSVYWLCEAEGGCPNLYNSDTRNQYADAFQTTYVGYAETMVDLYENNCIMTRYADACAVGATEWQKAADAGQKFVDHLKNNEPTVEVGQALYPQLNDLLTDSLDATDAAKRAVAEKIREIDGSGSSTTGGAINDYFRDKEAEIATLVENASN
ncbi:MAG: hypothetical protein GXX90_08840, partial [Microbacteriaceae bacterium]|nr:hypothetical protein [Microbacteriaceae bacterium]